MPINNNGSMIIKPGRVSYTILKWMQEKEDTSALKNTTGHIISEKICDQPGETHGLVTIEQTFYRMVRNNVIYRDKDPRGFFSDYRINYWHKNIPADILANAPAEVKRSMVKTIDDMKPGQYMDDEGCVVTPGVTVTDGDPFNEDTTTVEDTDQQVEDTDQQVEEEPISPEEQVQELYDKAVAPRAYDEADIGLQPEEEEKAQEVSVPVEVKKDGKTMSITINLTINL